MRDLQKLSAVKTSAKTPSLFFLKSSHDEIAKVAIEEADSLIAERIQNGQAVILLGVSFQAWLANPLMHKIVVKLLFLTFSSKKKD